jgi:hypothetical protein
MSHKEYLKYGSASIKVIEECSELVKELCKIERFGFFAKDPLTGIEYNNVEATKKEADDVIEAIEKLMIELRQVSFKHYSEPKQ